ncbi:kynureninase [Deinococcus cellulosilyticus]|uniref:Kynureninase n=1 Tax=Deinococcus cellulosilyticus (strain DSM 18568 / NBRC 106333 / KACC 11606 / 5516J-15) TaxID=1223518 RepID=A0A511N5N4_DEIC1|nr:kynureninase [Deinococcus cellulosilyticus]GEM47711.1 kynureninase [Deinococcus cellulosilyticus NBRC 106333 = KACC 11606]
MLRQDFIYPEGIYLDGNSLGLTSHASVQAIGRRLQEWQEQAVNGWESWFGLAETLSPTLADLMGARPEEVIATGSITMNLHALLATFYQPTAQKKHLVATALDFPSDLYALQSWAERHDAELRLIPSRDGYTLNDEDIAAAFQEDVALVLLPTVLYASGQLLDIQKYALLAQQKNIVLGVDAAHSAGSVPHHLHAWGVDFAVWCSYKYLNAGPGAPGGLFVHEKHFDRLPGLRGWWGHQKASTFEMRSYFTPEHGAGAYQISTPSILALAGLEGALEAFRKVGIEEIRARSLELTTHFMKLLDEHTPELRVVTPREVHRRGGHVSVQHPQARLLSLALREKGIVPDFRAPDILRMAPVALYNTEEELQQTVQVLRELLDTRSYMAFEQKSTRVV